MKRSLLSLTCIVLIWNPPRTLHPLRPMWVCLLVSVYLKISLHNEQNNKVNKSKSIGPSFEVIYLQFPSIWYINSSFPLTKVFSNYNNANSNDFPFH
jgi:hypothetical protein